MPRLVEIISQPLSDVAFATRTMSVDSFEQLRAATPTSSSEIIQVDAGRMQGRLKHATLAGLSLGFGTFSRGLISRGVYSNERITIGFLLGDAQSRPGVGRLDTIRTWPPGVEHERRHRSGASFGAISVTPRDISNFFGPDNRLSDPSSWRKPGSFRAHPKAGSEAAESLRSIMTSFESRAPAITREHAEFWKRAILEAATAVIANRNSSDVFVASPVRLVRKAQEFVERSGHTLVHISELTTALRVPRRSLQRAFDEVLGISPIRYLRHKRLCEARILLREQTDPELTVADIAFRQGFSDFGRFSGYYRALFGENPSETVRVARLKRS
jgi:AraC family ethanolamine operon transcriptional activator